MPLLTSLLLLILAARMLGETMHRLNQPVLVGEILAGIVLGPAVLGIVRPSLALSAISDLAVFFIVLSAGLDMDFREVMRAFRGRGIVIAALGFLLPFLSGILVGRAFGMDPMRTIFLGLCIAITALPVAVRILESFNLLDSPIARYSVAAAVMNDVAALLALGVILSLPGQGGFSAIAVSTLSTGLKLAAFAGIILLMNEALLRARGLGIDIPRLIDRVVRVSGKESLFGIAVIFVLAFSAASEMLGFHSVIGAFFGALLISRTLFGPANFSALKLTLGSVSGGFLSPVFFAAIGLEFDPSALGSVSLVAAVLAASIASKIAAGWLGGRLTGLSRHDALGIGVILNGRGIIEIVVANIALERGFIGSGLFSVLVLMAVVTTLITPLLFRRFVAPRLRPEGDTGG